MAARLLAKQAKPDKLAADPIDIGLEALANDWEDFRTNHRRLEDDPGIESTAYYANDDYDVANLTYMKGAAKIEALRPQQPPSPQVEDTSFFRDITKESLPPLPRIELPTFSGVYSEWESFRDAFTTAVYLKQSLKDSAALMVQNVAVTDANFEPVWKEVCQRYTNSRMLAHAHLVELFDTQAQTKSSPVNMRSILDRTKEKVRALEALGCPTQYWDDILAVSGRNSTGQVDHWFPVIANEPAESCLYVSGVLRKVVLVDLFGTISSGHCILVFMTLRRLDSLTRYEWQVDLTNSDKQEKLVDSAYTPALPTFQQLELFLDHRIRALEMSMVESKPMQRVPNYKSVPVKARVYAVDAASGSPGEQPIPRSDKRTCPLCKEAHTIHRCETFKGRSAEERREQVYRLRLCLNCLGNHRVRDCRLNYACRTYPPTRAPESDPSASVNMVRPLHLNRIVLLATAQVIVCSPTGKRTQTRALLDSGSEITLIAEHVVHQLQLPRTSSSVNICGIGETAAGSARFQTDILVKSREHPEAQYTLTAMILPKLTGRLPRQHIAPVDTLLVNSDELADPYYVFPRGEDRSHTRCRHLRIASPPRTKKKLMRTSGRARHYAQLGRYRFEETTKELHRFWEIEEVSVPEQPLTPEDALCEEHFRETYSRNVDGRFVVRLPSRPHVLLSGDNNRSSCARSLQALDRRFAREPSLKETDSSFLTEYEKLGHMSVVPPPLQTNPVGIFHTMQYNNKARVMFRQILVYPDDQDLQRILWNSGEPGSAIDFRLQTGTYGTACAPFLAIRTLRELASLERDNLPLGAASLDDDSYVDDILSGADTLPDALRRRDELIELLARGKFELGKWAANHRLLLPFGTTEAAASSTQPVLPGQPAKMLGVMWSHASDEFLFEFTPPDPGGRPITKRVVLSWISRIFDPLGWIGPIVLYQCFEFPGGPPCPQIPQG
ncbi:hypothetical protein GEV33_009068 [Tenebrio molitor]|uniref:Peptidase A2 domain-containing protein n=1 Tax=Tenebrio molitor TaxID=7067 RepID=A0A8J6LA32_TENMO|nr:hypothetical protein GEV33_009068 [Tenebrio molitor]